MKKGTGIIIITAVFALLLWAGCAGQEDEVIDITVSEPAGTAAPQAEVKPDTAEKRQRTEDHPRALPRRTT